jgi:hypothetical protein
MVETQPGEIHLIWRVCNFCWNAFFLEIKVFTVKASRYAIVEPINYSNNVSRARFSIRVPMRRLIIEMRAMSAAVPKDPMRAMISSLNLLILFLWWWTKFRALSFIWIKT